MIYYKTKDEVEKMAEGGKILAEILEKALDKLKPGITELEIEKFTEDLILQKGAYPAFKKVRGYNFATCISTNDVVVHGIPGKYRFKQGDVVGIDVGVLYKGLYTDHALTKIVRGQRLEVRGLDTDRFLEVGEKALEEAIRVARLGNRIGHISKKIQDTVEGAGYSVVRSLVGHGVGRKLHEDPEVPGFLDRPIEKTPLLKEGMTIAVEVIYNKGISDVVFGSDNWTIKTKDGSVSGLFERTIAITEKEPVILT